MLNLEQLMHVYSVGNLDTEELMHIQSVKKIKDWFSKTDKQKQEYRKSYLQMLMVHFQDEKDLEYIKQVILVTDKILLFLQNARCYQTGFEVCDKDEEPFYRIYNMLWCEKEYLLHLAGVRAIRMHISMDLFRPLVNKIKNTEEYKKYKLKDLFSEYTQMLSLFEAQVSK